MRKELKEYLAKIDEEKYKTPSDWRKFEYLGIANYVNKYGDFVRVYENGIPKLLKGSSNKKSGFRVHQFSFAGMRIATISISKIMMCAFTSKTLQELEEYKIYPKDGNTCNACFDNLMLCKIEDQRKADLKIYNIRPIGCPSLTIKNVRDIRKSKKKNNELAKQYDVSESTIIRCRNHKTYRLV